MESRMQQNGTEHSHSRNVFRQLLAAKRKINLDPSQEVQTSVQIKENSRTRRFSEQMIIDEVRELEKRHNSRDKKLKRVEDIGTYDHKYTSLKDITYDKVLKNDLETHCKSLAQEGDALTKEEEEDLGYMTFKMIKKKEKHYMSDLRDKINSGSLSTQATKIYKSSLPCSRKYMEQKHLL